MRTMAEPHGDDSDDPDSDTEENESASDSECISSYDSQGRRTKQSEKAKMS
jgi:hypothetical protein